MSNNCDKCGARITKLSVPSFISEEARLRLVKEYEESGQANIDRKQAEIYERMANKAMKKVFENFINE